MGLDQYAFTVGKDEGPDNEGLEFAYWRKHNRLQGWMENLWVSKNPNAKERFNGEKLFLTSDDIVSLEKDILGLQLPQTSGFFFGNDSYSYAEESKPYADYDTDMQFLANAKKALDKGLKVYYVCSW